MNSTIICISCIFLIINLSYSQLIDSFSDGDFLNNPTWMGDTGSWIVISNSTSGPNINGSNTLRLNAQAVDGVEYLSTQISGSWGLEQSWGFWLGRRSNSAATTTNHSIVWLWASESNLESSTISGYRIKFGDNTGDDELVLQRVDNGTVVNILSSVNSVPNGTDDIGFLVRITRTSTSDWTIFTSNLPTTSGEIIGADVIPSKLNTQNNQGSVKDATYTNFDNGYIGVMAVHTSGISAISGAEFDNFYFDTNADASLPITLSSFTATAGDRRVTLRWVTESEVNNVGFEIYRSTDREGEYQLLSSYVNNPNLQGQFNSNTRHVYSFSDHLVINNTTYWYKLIDMDVNGTRTENGPISATPQTAAPDVQTINENIPRKFGLYQNYPNPFNPSTTLRFDIPGLKNGDTRISLSIYNALGQKIKLLYEGTIAPGSFEIKWNGKNDGGQPVPGGIYFAVLRNEHYIRTIKMVLIR